MAIITEKKFVFLENITVSTTTEYKIPNKIVCKKDGNTMMYTETKGCYICTNPNCTKTVSATEYIKQELTKQKEIYQREL